MNDAKSTGPTPLLLGSLSIRRFRSLYDVSLLPIQATMTVLTGENDGGKSTCLDAVDFLLGTYTVDDEDYFKESERDEAIEVEGVFYALDDVARMTPIRVRVRQQRSSSRVCEILDRVHREFQAHPAQLSLNDLRARMTELSISSPGGNAKAPIQAAAEAWIAGRPECLASRDRQGWEPMARECVHIVDKPVCQRDGLEDGSVRNEVEEATGGYVATFNTTQLVRVPVVLQVGKADGRYTTPPCRLAMVLGP